MRETWEGKGDPTDVSVVDYVLRFRDKMESLTEMTATSHFTVTSCSNITARQCDLSKEFTDCFSHYTARVYSFTPNEKSPSAELMDSLALQPLDTEMDPPIVEVFPAATGIEVFIRLPVSYLWDESEERYVSILNAYPAIDYEISLEPSTKVPIIMEAVSTENTTRLIPSLLPNTNYCVSVSMMSENMKSPFASSKKCVITRGSQLVDNGDNSAYWIAAGVTLLVMLAVLLIVLHQAGYIDKKKIFTPHVLTFLPELPNFVHEASPPIYTPVEIFSIPHNENVSPHLLRSLSNAPYLVHNHRNDAIAHQEDQNHDTDSPSNGGLAREDLACPLLELTGINLSECQSAQPTTYLDNDISTAKNHISIGHHAGFPVLERSVRVTSEHEGDESTENFLLSTSNRFNHSFDVSLNGCVGLSIDLNSVLLTDSGNDLPNLMFLTGESDVLSSKQPEHEIDHQDLKQCSTVLEADTPIVDRKDNEDEDNGTDLDENSASDYVKR
ncbi:interferon alpha/beta receptor 2 [Hyperolius riggenbachi]|uniref:interferon alpha/beta receptor 2 n=1 Tax=Hyperolius riggenbachi TaxID=752182 RepID=UPI0035A2B35A